MRWIARWWWRAKLDRAEERITRKRKMIQMEEEMHQTQFSMLLEDLQVARFDRLDAQRKLDACR